MHKLNHFLSDDSGAVTVDWVVLTAGITGLGMATVGVVSTGMSDLSGDINAQLGSNMISSLFGSTQIASMNFTNGDMGGWVGGTVMAPIEALGDMLVLGPGESTGITLDVPAGAESATLTFDLIGGDSLDNEVMTITTNGETVTLARGLYNGTMTFITPDVEGITVSTEVISEGTNLGGATPSHWRDSVTQVTITVDDPGDTLAFGMTSGANQHIGDEFFGIDNVDISAN